MRVSEAGCSQRDARWYCSRTPLTATRLTDVGTSGLEWLALDSFFLSLAGALRLCSLLAWLAEKKRPRLDFVQQPQK